MAAGPDQSGIVDSGRQNRTVFCIALGLCGPRRVRESSDAFRTGPTLFEDSRGPSTSLPEPSENSREPSSPQGTAFAQLGRASDAKNRAKSLLARLSEWRNLELALLALSTPSARPTYVRGPACSASPCPLCSANRSAICQARCHDHVDDEYPDYKPAQER